MNSTMTLWERFANYDNFLLAWQRTVNCSSRIVHDELGLRIFAYNLQANLEDLVRKVQAEDFPYTPLADHKVYVPKPSTTLRTMSLMAVPDLIVYQALVNVIADETHPYLVTHENQHVWGSLYAGPGKRWMLKSWKRQYWRFVNYIEKLYRAGNTWIASTDIVAFFDTIDHERLLGLVDRYCASVDVQFKDMFRACLSKWSAHSANITMSRGIPQGSNASDFLANLFLYEIDREMIVNGYHYTRYVDDVRILGPDKPTVQHGLILFDLALKRAGLVAQVSKTSVHEIKDIEQEVIRLRVRITDPSGNGNDTLITMPSPPRSEQAASTADYINEMVSDNLDGYQGEQSDDTDGFVDDEDSMLTATSEPSSSDETGLPDLQQKLREKFLETVPLLDDPNESREAEATLTFCLYRLDPHESIRANALDLLYRLPWRSEAITIYLARFKRDPQVAEGLKEFIAKHDVYSWHRANALWALSEVAGAYSVGSICRAWIANSQMDWHSRTIAARLLAQLPGQHAYFMECLQREQGRINDDPEETAILRQELAHGAFQRIKSPQKQLALFRLMCLDGSSLLKRLVVYLLQQPECNITWDDIKPYHQNLGELAELIISLGISTDTPRPCFIAKTLAKTYEVSLTLDDLRPFYASHYPKAVESLRKSTIAYHKLPNEYISAVHQFAHITLIAFYEYVWPAEGGLYEAYAKLIDRQIFTNSLSKGVDIWRRLGAMRNRVDHPVDKKTRSHSQKITTKEAEFMSKELQVALQEMFDVWLNVPALVSVATSATPVIILPASSASPATASNP